MLLTPEHEDQKPYVAIIKVSSLSNVKVCCLLTVFFEDTLGWNIDLH